MQHKIALFNIILSFVVFVYLLAIIVFKSESLQELFLKNEFNIVFTVFLEKQS